jgi:isopentenyl diphosphate isomerase/L-lactate dehydrogenase-like FMN-dependent dehydrogenase/biotin carboxylase
MSAHHSLKMNKINNNGNEKTIMIIGGGIMQVPAIKIAKEMGLKVIVTDNNPKVEGLELADYPMTVSTRNIDMTVMMAKEFARTHPIHGVFTVGTDASKTVAAVANALNLPGVRYEVAETATNKIKMRERLKEKGIPVPGFRGIWALEEAKKAVDEMGLPLVIKPSDNMGARGVKKILVKDELIKAFYEAKDASITGEVIIEEFMEGPELSIDALIYKGKIFITGVADRIIEKEPYFVETGHIMPSNLPEEDVKEACEMMKDGIRALGIDMGTAKGDIKMTHRGPRIGELAARLSGGFMSAYTYPLSTGVDILKPAMKISMGENSFDLKPKLSRVSVEKAIIGRAGRLVSISGVDEARKIKGVAEIFIHREIGSTIEELKSNLGKVGNIITVASTREEALKINQKAMDMIKIKIDPHPELDIEAIKSNARKRFNLRCKACELCDGKECAGEVPGMGGIGTGSSFKANLEALSHYKINIKTIHGVKNPDLSVNLFGKRLKIPVLAAPITGTKTNMGGAMEEKEYAETVLKGCENAGTIGMVGDGAASDKYKIGLNAIKMNNGWGIPIFKPREFNEDILKRIREAETAGALAVGVDVDGAVFTTMELKEQAVGPKSREDLKYLIQETKLPFIIKGIMSEDDAISAAEAGAKAIVISNHGGRVLDYMPGAADILPNIVRAVGNKMTILIDGGIRTGSDVLKCLALGADAVLVGRPIAVGAVGCGIFGVEYILNHIASELKRVMILTGSPDITSINPMRIIKGENSYGELSV